MKHPVVIRHFYHICTWWNCRGQKYACWCVCVCVCVCARVRAHSYRLSTWIISVTVVQQTITYRTVTEHRCTCVRSDLQGHTFTLDSGSTQPVVGKPSCKWTKCLSLNCVTHFILHSCSVLIVQCMCVCVCLLTSMCAWMFVHMHIWACVHTCTQPCMYVGMRVTYCRKCLYLSSFIICWRGNCHFVDPFEQQMDHFGFFFMLFLFCIIYGCKSNCGNK